MPLDNPQLICACHEIFIASQKINTTLTWKHMNKFPWPWVRQYYFRYDTKSTSDKKSR